VHAWLNLRCHALEQMYEFSGHSDAVNMCTFNLTCDMLASASDDSTLRLWRLPHYDNINRRVVKEGECVRVLRGVAQGYAAGHTDAVSWCDFSPDGQVLVSASDDTTVKTWGVTSGLVLRTLAGHAGWVTAICCSPFRSHLISGGDDGMLILWDIGFDPDVADKKGRARGDRLRSSLAHAAPVVSLTFSPDGRFVASAAADGALAVHHTSSSFARVAIIASLPASPLTVSFDREAWRLWVLAEGGRLVVYDIDGKACQQPGMHSLYSPASPGPAISPDTSPRRSVTSLTTGSPARAQRAMAQGQQQEALATFFLPRMSGGNHYSVASQAGNVCVCVCGDGTVVHLKLHNAVHTHVPPSTPRAPKRPGLIRIKDDDDDTDEIEWEEFSGPLSVRLERVGGCDGRASVHFSTRGTNDDDPDFVAAEGIIEWEDGDAEDKLIWLAMRSYNSVEWDAQSCVICTHPDSGEQLRLQGLLADFGTIALAEVTRQTHSTPYTLHPTPYSLHPTPYTLHPTPYNQNLLADFGNCQRSIALAGA